MRGLFLFFLAVCLVGGSAGAVEMLSAEDEADIFGNAEPVKRGGGAEYIEFYEKGAGLKGAAEEAVSGDVFEDEDGGKAVVYGSFGKLGQRVGEERDRPVYVSPFVKVKEESAPEGGLFASYKDMAAQCGGNEAALKESLRAYKSAATLKAVKVILDNEAACYKDVGHAVIEGLYRGDEAKAAAFAKAAEGFIVRADGVNFDAKFCGENCSVEAVVAAQKAKFAGFRDYLYRLIDEAKGKN